MKLDRNLNPNGRGKYALLKLRRLAEIENHDGSGAAANRLASVREAIASLERHGLIDWGNTVDSEFFLIRLKDAFAGDALHQYAMTAMDAGEEEYGMSVRDMARRAGENHPNCKKPD